MNFWKILRNDQERIGTKSLIKLKHFWMVYFML